MKASYFSVMLASAALFLILTGDAFAHCDTAGGLVIPEARSALNAGDVTPVLKWVKSDHETAIREAFAKTLKVRAQSLEAKELADQYFIETLVRLHRAGEGAPYTGISDAPVAPIVSMADKALAEGSADEMIEKMNEHMTAAIREKFERAVEARKHKDESVEAGREYVEAYVTYMHYVEGIHDAILSAGEHHHGDAE